MALTQVMGFNTTLCSSHSRAQNKGEMGTLDTFFGNKQEFKSNGTKFQYLLKHLLGTGGTVISAYVPLGKANIKVI